MVRLSRFPPRFQRRPRHGCAELLVTRAHLLPGDEALVCAPWQMPTGVLWLTLTLDHYADPDIADATNVPLRAVPYHPGDAVLENGKVLLRPDDWDKEHFPHVVDDLE